MQTVSTLWIFHNKFHCHNIFCDLKLSRNNVLILLYNKNYCQIHVSVSTNYLMEFFCEIKSIQNEKRIFELRNSSSYSFKKRFLFIVKWIFVFYFQICQSEMIFACYCLMNFIITLYLSFRLLIQWRRNLISFSLKANFN